jgi:glutamate synthase domain-containing protein 2
MIVINKYLPLPPHSTTEFWDSEKIFHIRSLALFGKPKKIYENKNQSLRILDRINFIGINDYKISENPTSDISCSVTNIWLSSPIYLGDMSYGSLSGNPNIAIAKVADMAEILAGTGEGGLHPEVAKYKRIFIQWASARFGVDINVLMKGCGIVIKIGQGAKPGIGGHLPGSKVTEPISLTRRIPVGIDALSPAPHHDIYSIEDLGQRIEALKEATGKPVFVKVAATNYIPYIVSGIARMGADGVIIDGHGAGTGAAPTVVKDNVGIPIELAVASADKILKDEGLRENFTIIAGGRVSCAMDAAKLIALGADVVSLGTAALLAMGCLMIHKCHLGSCPVALTNKIDGTKILDLDFATKSLYNFVKGFSLELANILDNLGLNSIKELKGRRDLLYGKGLSEDVLKILGIKGESEELHFKIGELWNKRRKNNLNELIKKGDVVISSMGSTAPPDVELPARILDWIRVDGAQVTRPSVDPYREEIDTSFILNKGRIKISMPIIFSVIDASDEVREAISWASLALSSLIFSYNAEEPYSCITISSDGNGIAKWSRIPEANSYLLIPSDDEIFDKVNEIKDVAGYIIDEDLGNDELELIVSDLDTFLKKKRIRNKFDIIAKSSKIRDAGDVFKLIALGADAVILSSNIFEIALEGSYRSNLKEKAFNLMVGLKREIALLAGAAGIYSLQSTLTGNRELLRSINLNKKIREKLRIKPAGSL